VTSQPVEANVVLTADNTQYDQAMNQSTQSTDRLGSSLDSLGRKISSITKMAGKSLLGITAADVGMVTSFTAAWNSYEKQMARLEAQAAVLSRSQDTQRRTMKDYTAAVKGLRNEYGTTTGEAAKLVQTLAKVTDQRQTRGLQDLSKVFVDMSHATGESSDGLASSLTNLQKIMGTPVNAKTTRDYADTFTYLAAQTNTSAQGLIDFTAQLAPVSKQLGMSTQQVAGFATAFTKAGAEGFTAANVYNKVTTDLAQSLATGSPQLKQYANLVGLTVESFKRLDPAEQFVEILEAIQSKGKGATIELQRMGLDAPRTIAAVNKMVQDSGGIREALGMATDPNARGAAARGAEASTKSLTDEFGKLRQEMEQTAESMATVVGPGFEKVMQGIVKLAGVVQDIAEGPIGEFLQVVMAIVAPLTAGAGALLLFAGALLKVASAFMVLRNSGSMGVREGMRGAPGIVRNPDGTYSGRGGAELGTFGGQLAAGPSTMFQRGLYNTGQMGGYALRQATGGIRGGWQAGRSWFDPNYTPGPQRSVFSYMAGGTGRAIDMLLTPQFDQMRYSDPTRRVRSQFFSPTVPVSEEMATARAASEAARAQARMSRDVFGATVASGVGGDVEERARRQMHRDNQAAAAAERASRQLTVAQTEAVQATRTQSREVSSSTTGFRRLGQSLVGLGGGAIGGLYGAGATGVSALMRSGMGAQIGAGVGLAGMQAAGVQSNMLTLGAMGTMIMPGYGTAAGAAVGAALDMAQGNNDVADSIKNINDAADEASQSGMGLAGLNDEFDKTQTKLNDFQKTLGDTHPHDAIVHTGRWLTSIKNDWEGWLGTSDVDELQQQVDEAGGKLSKVEGTIRDLAKQSGVKFTGTRENQLQQMEQFMQTTGAAGLSRAGIDFGTLQNLRNMPLGAPIYQAVLAQVGMPSMDQSVQARLTAQGGAGAALYTNREAQLALQNQGDVAQQYRAVNSLYRDLRGKGMTNLQILGSAVAAQAEIGVESDPGYILQAALAGRTQQNLQIGAPMLTRTQGLQQQIGAYRQVAATAPTTGPLAEQAEQMRTATAQAFVDQGAYFKQLLLAQQQFELSRSRAQEDYNLQRQYSEYDFNLSRERAEENYQRQRSRGVQDYYRGVRRANQEFNIQRRRQEADFNHQVEVQATQMAQSVYNIYERVQTQRTSSAEWILNNARDQLQRMQEQEQNLDALRQRGLSNTAIQQLGLTDPNNAQQLARFVTEVTPQMIAQFNKVAGSERVKAAKELVTDPSSLEFQEMVRGQRVSMRRAKSDFDRMMEQGHDDFERMLKRQDDDFDRMMSQQLEDYHTGMARQEKAYNRQMDRAAEDFANMANEIDMSLEQVLETATTKLSGHAQEQAQQVLKSFKNLKHSAKPEAVALMQDLADIFGFEYTAPKKNSAAEITTPSGKPVPLPGAYNTGGTVPGYNPGRDTHVIMVGGGEGILRPEATRALGGSRAIDAINHAAKHGGFAEGGVYWPVPGHEVSTYPGHDGIDINRGSGSDDLGDPIRAFRSGVISYVGTGHGYGQAIFESTTAAPVVYGHTSKVYVKAGQQVEGGQLIGLVGSTGNSSAPHLHFGIPGGTSSQAMALLAGAMISGFAQSMFGGPAAPDLAGVLKDSYPKAEKAAAEMSGVHPLQPGMISSVINRFARKRIRQLGRTMGFSGSDMGIGREPGENLTNEQIVHTGANRLGWGDQWSALRQLIMHESGFNNRAQNPNSTAYGMFQFLDSTWAGTGIQKTSDPWKQTQAGLRYIKDRYGSPADAWAWWQDHNWYKNGSVFTSPQTIGVGEAGPEAVIPLNAKGGEFMADVMARSVGMGGTPAGGSMHVYNTRVDRSTNFTGPIMVQANNPEELLAKLQQRQRVMALSRPSLTGSAA